MFEQFAVVRQIKCLPLGRKLTGPWQDDAVLGGVWLKEYLMKLNSSVSEKTLVGFEDRRTFI